jgi:DNA-binding transcriptional MerR regulator
MAMGSMSEPEGSGTNGLTVGQASARLGVTVRALHHWDEIGLAQPSLRTDSGYRLYMSADLARLQRIVIYRELDLGLDAIRSLLDDPATDPRAALRAQREQVAQRISRLERLADGLDRMIHAHEHGLVLTAQQQAAIFGPDWDPDWITQARNRWGHTEQWAQYAERAANRSPQDWQAITQAAERLNADLAEAMDAGVEPGSPEANQLAERHREAFGEYFVITHEMQVCLGRKYETNAEFSAYYNAVRPGLASWLRKAIDANAAAHGIDPDTATWQ